MDDQQLVAEADCLYASDLVPFTRKPLFLIVDSDNSSAFAGLNSAFGAPYVALLSPEAQPCSLVKDATHTGNLFTYFLYDPLAAFFFVADPSVDQHTIPHSVYLKATALLDWAPVWDFADTVRETVAWYRRAADEPAGVRTFTLEQISRFEQAAAR